MMDVKTLSGALDYLLLETVVVSVFWTEVFCIITIIIITCDVACSLMGDLVLLVKLLHRMVQKLITSPYKNYLNSCNHYLHK